MNNAIPPLLQAASGALGSIAGNAVVFPLDLATTRMQHARPRSKAYRLSLIGTLYRLIQSRNGVSHLYAGLKADTISTLLSSYIYFYLYSTLHQLAIRRHAAMSTVPLGDSPALKGSKEKKAAVLGTAEELLIGMLSGIISKGIVLPVSAVCRRQQMEDDDDHHGHAAGQAGPKEKVSLVESIKAIHREQGFLGLYSALPPSVPLALLPSLTLYIHTILLRVIVPAKHRTHPPGAVTFLIGALSNALATLPLYPMIMIKALSQTNASGRGVTAAIKDAVGREGTAGLYRGLEGQLVKGFVQQGVMMLIKQRIEEGVVKAYRRSVT